MILLLLVHKWQLEVLEAHLGACGRTLSQAQVGLWAVFFAGVSSLPANCPLSVQVCGYSVSPPSFCQRRESGLDSHELRRKVPKVLEGCDREARTLHVLEPLDICLTSLVKVIRPGLESTLDLRKRDTGVDGNGDLGYAPWFWRLDGTLKRN